MSNDALSLNQYREVCSRLDHAYGVLLESDVLPVQGCTAESVSTRRRALAAGRFSVAICGQVKAGKSTLLNALVFQAPVLPADDLPMTAKITILRYRKETGLEAHFWSATEWADLVADYKADGNVYADFEDEIKQATLSGHSPGSWITAEGRVVREEGLGGISKYVSVVANGGVLSPYVKEVIAFHGNDAFADVDVVDTPGMNDPSKLRTQLIERWIQGVDAVVYVSYAGHAMAEADVSFIRTHLGGVSPSRRVLAINKIDLVDRAGLERYVASLRSSPREEVRAVMAPATQTAFVAAGARLLLHARTKGVTMEGLEYSFQDSDWLNGLHDGMDTLRSMIEQRLITRRGQEFLESHRAYLLWIADLFDIQCDKAREDLAAVREYLRIKHGEADLRRRELRAFKVQLRGAIEHLRCSADEIANQATADLDGALQSMFRSVSRATQERISLETSLTKLRFATRVSLQMAWSEHRKLDSANSSASSPTHERN